MDVKPINCAGAELGGMHAHFADCIRNGVQPPLANAYAARHVTEILLAGMESSRTGRAVDLKTRADA